MVRKLNFVGASALHLAIAYSNNELVQDLVEAGANVNQRATGEIVIGMNGINNKFNDEDFYR